MGIVTVLLLFVFILGDVMWPRAGLAMFSLLRGSTRNNLQSPTTSHYATIIHLEFAAPLEWVWPVGEMVYCAPLEVVPLDENLGEYGDGSAALLPLPCPLLQLLFCETSH